MKVSSHQFNLVGSPCDYPAHTAQGLLQSSNLGNSALAYSLDDVVAFLFCFQLRKLFRGANFSYLEESSVSFLVLDICPGCVKYKSINNNICRHYNCIISLTPFNYSTYSLDIFHGNKTKTVLSHKCSEDSCSHPDLEQWLGLHGLVVGRALR